MRALGLLLVFLLVVTPLAAYGTFDWLLGPVSGVKRRALVVIAPGTGVAAVAHQLQERQLIRNDLAFRLYVRIAGLDHGIKAGAYAFSPDMGARAIAAS